MIIVARFDIQVKELLNHKIKFKMEQNNFGANNNNNHSDDHKKDSSNNQVDSGFLFDIVTRRSSQTVQIGLPVASKRDDLYYNMENPVHGRCIILNFEKFHSSELRDRQGTENDSKRLEDTFKKLNFIIQRYDDLTLQKTMDVLKRESKMNHSDYNCFVICILTHGSNGILHTKDKQFNTNKMFEYFTGTACPTLVGKPKLFFLQACQGEMFDSGVLVHDSPVGSPSYFMVPNYADFLIFYSTFPGYYSWRNTQKGSWFIQTLCDVLEEGWQKYDLMTLLTIVCRRVAIDYESNVPNDSAMHRKKQIPCIMSTLTRLMTL